MHTWNCATGSGGIGILNTESQNRFVGVYLDFTDLKNVGSGAQDLTVADGFFLGDAQLVFAASAPGQAVYGVALSGNVWYDCSKPALASNETMGTFSSVTDFSMTGTSFCGNGQTKTGFVRATITTDGDSSKVVDFSSVLLFPNAPIASATVSSMGSVACAPSVGAISGATVTVGSSGACTSTTFVVTADQSAYSTWSKQ